MREEGNSQDHSDIEEILPWSPALKGGFKEESFTNTPSPSNRKSPVSFYGQEGHQQDTPFHVRRFTLSPKTLNKSLENYSCSEISYSSSEEATTPVSSKVNPSLWSPPPNGLNNAEPQVAYLFGDKDHPIVEEISNMLDQNHNIKLTRFSEGPPTPPYPLFYIEKKGYNTMCCLLGGRDYSGGNCILIKSTESTLENLEKLPSGIDMFSKNNKEHTILEFPANWADDEEFLEKFCQEIADCTQRVYETKAPELGFF